MRGHSIFVSKSDMQLERIFPISRTSAIGELSPMADMRSRERVLLVVAAIPEGRVTTYGTIAHHLDLTARQVASVLASFTKEESATLPWFRVVAANGVVSTAKLGAVGRRQIARLRAEGLTVTPGNRIADFEGLMWDPVEEN
jgi:methylated-DNA-protein-cysteine methyltransferase related protein